MPRGGRRRRRTRNRATTSQPPEPSRTSPSSNVEVDDNDGGGVYPPSSPQPTAVLDELIVRKKWDEASIRCRTHPQDAGWKGRAGWLPIHEACVSRAPLSLVRQLHEAYGEGIRTTYKWGELPLHFACTKASLEVITYLHGQYPQGATKKDNEGCTPIDCLADNRKLSEEDRAAARAILSSPPVARAAPQPQQQQKPTKHTPADNARTTSATAAITTTSTGDGPRSHVEVPGENDVLLVRRGDGGGGRVLSLLDDHPHRGNEILRKLVDGVHSTCQELPAMAHATKLVLAKIRSLDPPGRFLERVGPDESGWWIEVSDVEARNVTLRELLAAAADAASEAAVVSVERPEAAEAEAGTAARAGGEALDEAETKHAAAKEAARFGRRKTDVTEWNATRLRREAEAEAARWNLPRTAVAASNALAQKREVQYTFFAEDRDKLKLPFFESTMHLSPSVVLFNTSRPRTPSPPQAMPVEADTVASEAAPQREP